MRKFRFIFLLLLSWGFFYSGQTLAANNLPEIGTAGASALTIEKEMQYGKAFSVMARGGLPVLDDPLLNNYVTDLGQKLVANADSVRFPFNFFLVQNNDINAAAFFGGYIKIHTGLFLYADNESQLASVVAHEIAHVTQRHLARIMESQARNNPANMAAMAGALLLTLVSPEAGIAALQTTLALNLQSNINFTRTHEFEADRLGIKTMQRSGFDTREMGNFFGKLAAKYRYVSTPPQMLLTHPLPDTRVTESRARAAQYKPRNVPPSLPFQLSKARIEVRYSNMSAEASYSFFTNQIKNQSYALKEAALYGQALALMEQQKYPEADVIIDQLLAANPRNLFYVDVKTDLDIFQKRHKQAIERLQKFYKQQPKNQVVAINLVNAAMEGGDYDLAHKVLSPFLREYPNHALAWSMAIQVYQARGQLGKAYHARAEYLALHGDFKKAISELQIAIAETDAKLERARLEAKVEQYKASQAALDALRS